MIALIIDHSLGEIEKINSREIPLFEKFFLPKELILFYASGDGAKKNDTVLTQALCEADRFSTEHLSSPE